MSRTYCGTTLGGTTPDSSSCAGSMAAALSMVTISPDSMVSTGFTLAAKCPIWTVCGLGISVCSAACAAGTPAAATNSSAHATSGGTHGLSGWQQEITASIGMT